MLRLVAFIALRLPVLVIGGVIAALFEAACTFAETADVIAYEWRNLRREETGS